MPPQNPYGQQPNGSPSPQQPMYGTAPQQRANGQYEVLPPLAGGPNNGHSGHNPYEFIVNPNTPQKRGSMFGGGDKFWFKIGLLVGGVVALLVIAGIVVTMLAPKGSTPGMTAIAQRQQEIIRVSTAATTQALGQDTQNFASTTQAAITSDQLDVLANLSAHGVKLKQKQLGVDQDAQTDTLLANALTAGTYDKAAAQALSGNLATYEDLLQTTYKQTSNKEVRTLLQHCYTSADKLLKQAKVLSS